MAKTKADTHPIFTKITEGTVTADDFNKLIQEAVPECLRDRVRRHTIKNATDSHQEPDTGHQPLDLPTFADRVQPKRERQNSSQMHGRGKLGHRHSTRAQRQHTESKRRYMLYFDKGGYYHNLREEFKKRNFIEGKHYSIQGQVLTLAPKVKVDKPLADWLYQVGKIKRIGFPLPDIFAESIPAKFRDCVKFITENMGAPLKNCPTPPDRRLLAAVATKLMTIPGIDRDWLVALHPKE